MAQAFHVSWGKAWIALLVRPFEGNNPILSDDAIKRFILLREGFE